MRFGLSHQWRAVLDDRVHHRPPAHAQFGGHPRNRPGFLAHLTARLSTGPAGEHRLGVDGTRFSVLTCGPGWPATTQRILASTAWRGATEVSTATTEATVQATEGPTEATEPTPATEASHAPAEGELTKATLVEYRWSSCGRTL